MIRTLHLINGLGTGGAERSLAELLPELPDYGIQPVVAVFHQREEGVESEVVEAGVDVRHIEGDGWGDRILATRRLVRQIEPHVVHTTLFEADVVGRFAALGTPANVLTSLVNTSYEPVRLLDTRVRRSRLRVAQLTDSATAHLTNQRFHAITNAVRDSAVHRLKISPDRITVVPRGRRRSRLGEPTPDRRRRVRHLLGLPVDSVVLLHVGREEYQKGHTVLLEAAAPILMERSDVVLLMAGRSGNASSKVDLLIRDLPHAQVMRLGHVDHVPDLLAAADVFVFPSLYEGLGGAALEAMAMEVPIVASDLPALREYLEGIAVFADGGSATSLRSVLMDVVVHHDDARRRASAGRERFDRTYEHAFITEAMADLVHRTAVVPASLRSM